MDNKQIGEFIGECRKNKQLTQQELADLLNITNKTISKWETGNGLPDISMLTLLAEALDVTTDELLKAKKAEAMVNSDHAHSTDQTIQQEANPILQYMVHKAITKFRFFSIISVGISIAGLILPFLIWFETRDFTGWFFGCWLEICSAGIFFYYRTLMKHSIGEYNRTADSPMSTREISKPILRILILPWIMICFLSIFFIINK